MIVSKKHKKVLNMIDLCIKTDKIMMALELAKNHFGIKGIGTLEDIMYPEKNRIERLEKYLNAEEKE